MAVAGASVLLYLFTLYPGVGGRLNPGDSAKFQFVGSILGVPHPTGYPVYILLSFLWGQIPLPVSLASRINVLSAIFAALTNLVVFLILRAQLDRRDLALALTAMFAVTRTYWAQATEAKVYTLNSLLLATIIWLATRWEETRSRRVLAALGVVLALSLGNHSSTVALLPALGYLLARPGWRTIWSRASAGWAGLCAILIVVEYSYIYIRSQQGAPYLEGIGPHASMGALVDYLSGGPFKRDLFGVIGQGMVTATLLRLGRLLVDELGLVVLALSGLALFLVRGRFATFLRILLAAQGLFILAVDYKAPDIQVHLIPIVLVLVLILGQGLGALVGRLSLRVYPLLTGGLSAVVVWLFLTNLPVLRVPHNPWEAAVKPFLDAAESGTVIVADTRSLEGYYLAEVVLYYLYGERYQERRGIEVYFLAGGEASLRKFFDSGRPVYADGRLGSALTRRGFEVRTLEPAIGRQFVRVLMSKTRVDEASSQ